MPAKERVTLCNLRLCFSPGHDIILEIWLSVSNIYCRGAYPAAPDFSIRRIYLSWIRSLCCCFSAAFPPNMRFPASPLHPLRSMSTPNATRSSALASPATAAGFCGRVTVTACATAAGKRPRVFRRPAFCPMPVFLLSASCGRAARSSGMSTASSRCCTASAARTAPFRDFAGLQASPVSAAESHPPRSVWIRP